MTNEEVVEELESRKLTMSMCIDIESCRKANKAIDIAINSIQENTKLKAEIEKLNAMLKAKDVKQDFNTYCELRKQNEELISETIKLKSELEQSVKLPCKVGQIVYEIKSKFTKCTEHNCEFDDYSCQGCECLECDSKKEYYIRDIKFYSAENILVFERHFGKTIFLTQEEAEQSLKGQV